MEITTDTKTVYNINGLTRFEVEVLHALTAMTVGKAVIAELNSNRGPDTMKVKPADVEPVLGKLFEEFCDAEATL